MTRLRRWVYRLVQTMVGTYAVAMGVTYHILPYYQRPLPFLNDQACTKPFPLKLNSGITLPLATRIGLLSQKKMERICFVLPSRNSGNLVQLYMIDDKKVVYPFLLPRETEIWSARGQLIFKAEQSSPGSK